MTKYFRNFSGSIAKRDKFKLAILAENFSLKLELSCPEFLLNALSNSTFDLFLRLFFLPELEALALLELEVFDVLAQLPSLAFSENERLRRFLWELELGREELEELLRLFRFRFTPELEEFELEELLEREELLLFFFFFFGPISEPLPCGKKSPYLPS
ncbi:MAG: hypothetical protein QM613_00195 [Micrococcaceae bacterium]